MRRFLSLLVAATATLLAGLAGAQSAPSDSVGRMLALVGREFPGRPLPANATVTAGARTVVTGAREPGDVATAGRLEVLGDVGGHAYALGGDLIVGPGGHIKGDAVSVGGEVRLDGGTVDGEIRRITTARAPKASADEDDGAIVPAAQRSPFAQALGWLVVILLVGIGTLVFADRYLDGVVRELERSVPRAFFIGLAGELALAPGLALICVALALTLLGILIIPFAIVAFVLAAAGLLTLGYLGVASLVGNAFLRDAGRHSARGAALRALLVGIVALMAFWLVAGLVGSSGILLLVTRGLAVAITWVAATAGFGAALASRGGALKRRPVPKTPAGGTDLAWQTPTPVRGVAAAKRPVATTTAGGSDKR
jgi:hypothetical protein